MKTRRVRKAKAADWRFLAALVLVMLVIGTGIIYYGVLMQPHRPRSQGTKIRHHHFL